MTDYSLTGKNAALAVEKGLAEARWYASPVPKEKMRELLERRDGPAIRATLLWFFLLAFFATCGFLLWGTGWAIIPFLIYGVLYASTSDSRWHESSHGTAFKTDWMNNVLYEIASFMVLRESTPWRWSHARHHSDTIIVGRDAEIAVQRPAKLVALILNFFNVNAFFKYVKTVYTHCTGRMTPEELTYTPASERRNIVLRAWIYVAIYASVIAAAIMSRSLFPVMLIGLPSFYGAWLMVIYGYTQHAGLAENVLDHRLNSRTVYMNRLNRYLYWNMNYHLEHHMFPLVPYHALPKLHELIKQDTPTPYKNILEAYKEIIPTIIRQAKDRDYYVKRQLPPPTQSAETMEMPGVINGQGRQVVNGWVELCDSSYIQKGDIIRFDFDLKTYAIYRTAEGEVYATAGNCTHGNAHLADGMLSGTVIECAKHNGRFDIRDGSPRRLPVCLAVQTYPMRESDGKLFLNVHPVGGAVGTEEYPTYTLRVVSNENVATFIKELVLELDPASPALTYRPGEYLQFNIPVYANRRLREISVSSRYASAWEVNHAFDLVAGNNMPARRNYSFASNPAREEQLRFNVRLSSPPPGTGFPAGVGSTYIFGLQPGDEITAIGPFGDFHIKDSDREMVYIGGGAGMAPLRAHLSYLLETKHSTRPISYWYGARSRQDIFYQDYFERLMEEHKNFSFHVALSEPLPGDGWTSYTGFIHEVVRREYLDRHPNLRQVEYYLCGPPAMVKAAIAMLSELGVEESQISYDEF